MAQKKTASSSKKSQKPRARVKDLASKKNPKGGPTVKSIRTVDLQSS